ncbi:predicted protein [Scheffersomyces stipitis CBS 6054]|uniref:Kinetochore protein Spc24 n=1 Tax=Scheffersomyces stipitis (strain ATCC 58785 / CBS 6054 / NBRC 10063 / NRRL Y-11545) TaxID=322104 RepID=A3LRM9_PICST|nr:predicted protein [Scheffersomyces stipitis CBS 6054]ABN65764.1 predicted protein [Scheffersomyces stipitis CBS 6054]KAG2733911.1 hypothetical protein G9P44_003436 [Scheffersomyces stipitis]
MIEGPPESILQQTIDSIEIDPELLTLERIDDTIRLIKNARDEKIDQLEKSKKGLEVTINQLNNEISLLNKISDYNYEVIRNITEIAGYSNTQINRDENIFKVLNKKSVELDNYKVVIAKNLNDLESSINFLRLNKTNLQKNVDELKTKINNLFNNPFDDSEANDDDLVNQDANILKINLYRNLGVNIDNFDDENGENDTVTTNDHILIHNKDSNVSSVFKVEPKYSDYFISNYLWDRL